MRVVATLSVSVSVSLSLLVACGGAEPPPASVARAPAPAPEVPSTEAPPPAEEAPVAEAPASCGPLATPATPSDPAAAFAEARALSDAGHGLEAADLFAAVVRADPHHELARPAAELSMDALDRVTGGPPGQRTACASRIGALAIEYAALFGCGAAGAPEETCEHLERLRCEALRVEAERVAEDGDLARASQMYERVYRTGCRTAGDEALYNAAVLARRASDPARADALVAELHRAFPESPVLRAPPP